MTDMVIYDTIAIMKIVEGVHWAGIVDPRVRSFFGQEMSTPQGTTFNVYLILDEQIACIASLRSMYIANFFESIERVADPADIDYLVINQMELNDPSALSALRRFMPSARMLVPAATGSELGRHPAWRYREMNRGEKLLLGSTELVFLETCGIARPDTMLMYIPGKNLLLSQYIFGQHWASSQRFDDCIDRSWLLQQALRYYVTLLAPSYKRVREIIKSLISGELPIDVIAPSNGVIWRSDPLSVLRHYRRWTERSPEKRAVVVYETMLKSTEYMAEAVVRGITSEGVPCSLFRISLSNREEILSEIFRAGAVLLGYPTLHRQVLPAITPLLQSVRALDLKNRIGAAFGSYGWSGESRKELEHLLKDSGISIQAKGVYAAMRPSSADLRRCEELGRRIAGRLKRSIVV